VPRRKVLPHNGRACVRSEPSRVPAHDRTDLPPILTLFFFSWDFRLRTRERTVPGQMTGPSLQSEQVTEKVKVFRCGPRREVEGWRAVGPRWQTSHGGSRGRPGATYGESVSPVEGAGLRGVNVARDIRLRERPLVVRKRGLRGATVWRRELAWSFGRPGRQVCGRCREGNRWWISQGDVHRVMRRPSVEERGSSAARRAGRSRRSALARREPRTGLAQGERDDLRVGIVWVPVPCW
jgi:hypothetical protein